MKYEVIVYSSDSCRFCVELKQWLSKNNIPYENKDLNIQHVYQEFEGLKVNGIPLIRLVDSKNNTEERIVGFQPEKIKEFLAL